jgi:hypothetical protein
MTKETLHTFSATIEIIDINPFVFVPEEILNCIFEKARKSKNPIPIKGTINAVPYTQTLMKFSGATMNEIYEHYIKKEVHNLW